MANALSAVLIVGTWHWSNPGDDFAGVTVADITSDQRQQEIEDVARLFAEFQPTRVAFECVVEHESTLNDQYQEYLQCGVPQSANEIHQLGFRVASGAGVLKVHGFDWHSDQEIGWDRLIDVASEHGESALVERVLSNVEQRAASLSAQARCSTISDLLIEVNSVANLEEDQATYAELATVGSRSDLVGAAVVSRWYERNINMFARLMRLVQSPEERIFVLVGTGHVPPLLHLLEAVRTVRIERPCEYLVGTNR